LEESCSKSLEKGKVFLIPEDESEFLRKVFLLKPRSEFFDFIYQKLGHNSKVFDLPLNFCKI